MGMAGRIWAGITRRYFRVRAKAAVARAGSLLHGPGKVALGTNGCGVVSLMKNAAYFVGPFIQHHQALGAAHILIVDNGSTDATVEIAKGFEGVTVIRNPLPAKDYECLLRAQTAAQVFRGGWVLFVDSDELFEIPYGQGASLPKLLSYLNQEGYSAMATQMLDMFSDQNYGATKDLDYAQTLTGFTQYSLHDIRKAPYHDRDLIRFNWFLRENRCETGVQWLIGGVRHEVFGEDCVLTKHSLVKNARGIELMSHPHCASGVVLADVTGLLRHYKLAGDYLDRDRRNLQSGVWDHAEDAKRLAAAKGGDGFAIAAAQAQPYRGPEVLVAQGFLQASARYCRFMAR